MRIQKQKPVKVYKKWIYQTDDILSKVGLLRKKIASYMIKPFLFCHVNKRLIMEIGFMRKKNLYWLTFQWLTASCKDRISFIYFVKYLGYLYLYSQLQKLYANMVLLSNPFYEEGYSNLYLQPLTFYNRQADLILIE